MRIRSILAVFVLTVCVPATASANVRISLGATVQQGRADSQPQTHVSYELPDSWAGGVYVRGTPRTTHQSAVAVTRANGDQCGFNTVEYAEKLSRPRDCATAPAEGFRAVLHASLRGCVPELADSSDRVYIPPRSVFRQRPTISTAVMRIGTGYVLLRLWVTSYSGPRSCRATLAPLLVAASRTAFSHVSVS